MTYPPSLYIKHAQNILFGHNNFIPAFKQTQHSILFYKLHPLDGSQKQHNPVTFQKSFLLYI